MLVSAPGFFVKNDQTYHFWGCRVLWKQSLDLENDVKKLKGDIAKAEKILDSAASGMFTL
jgi:hypothetical protein